MNFLDVLEQRMWQIAIDSLPPHVLEKRAIAILRNSPEVARAMVILRLEGKLSLPKREVLDLVKCGLVSVDDQGFYLSDIVEDYIDKVLEKADLLMREQMLKRELEAKKGN